jgi:hypothetical protein
LDHGQGPADRIAELEAEVASLKARLAEREVEKPRIIVQLSGGLIQSVTSSMPAEAMILDFDIEGADEEEVATLTGLTFGFPEAKDECFVGFRDTFNPEYIARI